MKPFWTPQSALFLPDPPSLATPLTVRLLLRSAPAELLYAGDRMWPSVRSGQRVVVVPRTADSPLSAGSVVVALPHGIPDLLRIASVDHGEALLSADADPDLSVRVSLDAIPGIARLPARASSPRARAARRLLVDLREAFGEGPDPASDPADTVRDKYDAQAPFYAQVEAASMPEALLAWCRERFRAGGRLLVAGSGTGRECFTLEREGWEVTGVDFSPRMVAIAREEARRRGLASRFEAADLRSHDEPEASLAGVFFTYDVYSFLPIARDRIELLNRMQRWLEPGAAVLLSARRTGRPFDFFVLTAQRAARMDDAAAGWGGSHTRWIGTDGVMHRSFVRVFTTRGLREEIERGGFRMGSWHGNHCLIEPASGHGAVRLDPDLASPSLARGAPVR